MWLKFVGSQTRGGISQDCEHEKYYWGPENNWTCEVPAILGIELMKSFGEAYEVIAPPAPAALSAKAPGDDGAGKADAPLKEEAKVDAPPKEKAKPKAKAKPKKPSKGKKK